MRSLKKSAFWIGLLLLMAGLIAAPTPNTARTRLADGFDQPVGRPDADGYYMSRGFRANHHLGEDWNGIEGGNKDLGKPVYCIGHGMVVFSKDVRLGWGNVVIVRHTFLEEGQLKTVDSLYGHLDKILVREGQQVVRGQQVGTIGNNRGMYLAHLHFEIRKNIYIGINRSSFKKDLSNYYVPTAFIGARRKLPGSGRSAMIAVNTFDHSNRQFAPPVDESRMRAGRVSSSQSVSGNRAPEKKPFRVNRFDDVGSF